MHIFFSIFETKIGAKIEPKYPKKIKKIIFDSWWIDRSIHRVDGAVHRYDSWQAEVSSHDPTAHVHPDPDPMVYICCRLKGLLGAI